MMFTILSDIFYFFHSGSVELSQPLWWASIWQCWYFRYNVYSPNIHQKIEVKIHFLITIQESGIRMFEKLVNYQTSISGISIKKLINDGW